MNQLEQRQKYIRDRVMSAITNSDGQTKFGLSGITHLFGGKATDQEVAEAVQYLIDNEYLKMLGRYVFGVGVNGDLKHYDLSDFDPFTKIPASPEKSASVIDGYRGEENAPRRPSIISLEGKRKAPVPEESDTDELTTDSSTDSASSAANDAIEIPSFTPPKSSKDPVEAAVNALQSRLKPTAVSNISIKCQVLQQLAKVLAPVDPFFGSVLDDIRTDYEQRLTAPQLD